MSREEFIQKVNEEIERQMRLSIAMVKLTQIAERTQKNAFSILSNDKFGMRVSNN
jgi:hypothetical protein